LQINFFNSRAPALLSAPPLIRSFLVFSTVFIIISGIALSIGKDLILSLSVQSPSNIAVQVFFDTGDGFKYNQSIMSIVRADTVDTLRIKMPGNTKRIRFDPATAPVEVSVQDLKLHRNLMTKGSPLLEKCLVILKQVELTTEQRNGFQIRSSGKDPQILIPESCIPQSGIPARLLAIYLANLVLVSVLAAWALNSAWNSRRTVVLAMISIAAGMLIMLVLLVVIFSKVNLHPDENSHIAASTFFQSHWFKLAIDHPSMLKTLIPGWGTSYLFLNDIVYSLSEKVTGFLVPLGVPDYLRYRLYNFVLLPTLLILYIADRRNGIWFLLAFVLTSQSWYLFAYFNGDALGMFFSLLLAYFFVSHRKEIELFFWERSGLNLAVAGFYALCVLVLFTRLHYTIFVFFIIGLILVSRLGQSGIRSILKVSVRLAIFLLLVLLPLGAAELKDQVVNGFDKQETIKMVRKSHQNPEFNAEYIMNTGSNPHLLHFKQLGHPYSELFTKHPWVEWSFQSFFGVYGYMDIKATHAFYTLSSILGMGLTLIFLVYSAARSDKCFRLILAWLLLFVCLVIIQSSMYSWLNGFQAQGRYLLSIIPMIAVALALNPLRDRVPRPGVQFYVLVIFLVNVTGFAVYGVLPMINP
jgi:hypothetical protein